MGAFAKNYSQAKSSKGGVYFTEGDYKVEIVKVSIINTRVSGEQFCITAKILESTGPKALQPGTEASTMVKVGHDMFESTTKGFYVAAFSEASGKPMKEDEIDTDMAELGVSEANPLGGVVLRVNAVNITTRKGNPFTKLVWKPVTVQLPN